MEWFSVEAHLARARSHLTAPMPEALFYAALEFRYAVESRLMDYSEAAEDLVKNKGNIYTATSMTKHLNMTYKSDSLRPSVYTVTFHTSKLEKPYVVKYIPISPTVVSILGKVDNYLHAAGMLHCRNEEVARKLKELIARGVKLVEQSLEGGMHGPIMRLSNGKNHFSASADKHPELVGLFQPGDKCMIEVTVEPLPLEDAVESPSKGLH